MASDRIRLDRDWLQQWCGVPLENLSGYSAFEVAANLRHLAALWLRPEVLALAAEHAKKIECRSAAESWQAAPRLPQDCGACWIVVVNAWQLPLLRPAYVLPLRWSSGRDHDRLLPVGLQHLADSVLEQLHASSNVTGDWHLSFAFDTGLDLSAMDGRWESGWASLAAGLLLAAWEGNPDTSVWASGAWTSDIGIQDVSGLEAKLELAQQMGAETFFAPGSQVANLLPQSEAASVEICRLQQATTNPKNALREYLDRLELPPSRDEPRAKRGQYYLRIVGDVRARRYYQENILPDVIHDCQQELPPDLGISVARKLVTIFSHGFDLPKLALSVIAPSECLLLHDRELEADAVRLAREINAEGRGWHVMPRRFEGGTREGLIDSLRCEIMTFAGNAPPETLVFDMTGGQRLMTLAMYDVLPPDSHVVCFQGKFDRTTRRPIPFSGKLMHYWRVGSKGMKWPR